jgi:hypothetical protein
MWSFGSPACGLRRLGAWGLTAFGTALLSACVGLRVQNPQLHTTDEARHFAPRPGLLKVHMKSGELFALKSWVIAEDKKSLHGVGTHYSAERAPIGITGPQLIAFDDVALLETNDETLTYPFAAQSLPVLTTFWGALSGICLADPKSCFGSCPTFYADGGPDLPVAEGFSAAVARVLEERDVDALWDVTPRDGRVSLLMRNEALETQAVKSVRLLAAARARGGRVLATPDGRFYEAVGLAAPASCSAPEGDCLSAVRAVDPLERTSEADAKDLATRETIALEFPGGSGKLGLVIGARQTLLSTYLFYQSIAYMGASAGEFMGRLESGDRAEAERAMSLTRRLGDIEAEVGGADGWRAIGAFREAGPLAGDVQVLPFDAPADGASVRIRLRLAKGTWRLGYVALAQLGSEVEPQALEPAWVERDGRRDARALATLQDPERHLVTLPGDAYRLVFQLPAGLEDAELFLESRGYYYEWQRADWLGEQDPQMLALVITQPDEALRRLAAPFKEREAGMERMFWQSRFRR